MNEIANKIFDYLQWRFYEVHVFVFGKTEFDFISQACSMMKLLGLVSCIAMIIGILISMKTKKKDEMIFGKRRAKIDSVNNWK
ncbi:MAG: hypothetical protein ACOC2U_04085 [bacterium]